MTYRRNSYCGGLGVFCLLALLVLESPQESPQPLSTVLADVDVVGETKIPVPTRPLTFWTSDLHDGVRCDLASTLSTLGHGLHLVGVKNRTLPHPSCMPPPHSPGWVRFPTTPMAPYLLSHFGVNDYPKEAVVRSFFEFYRNDPSMASTDAIVCGFPLSMCEAFLPFNKTLVWWAMHRYSLGRCNQKRWERLNQHLVEASQRGDIIAASTRYDALYIQYYTGLLPLLLPSLSLFYVPQQNPWATHPPSRPEILLGPLQLTDFPHFADIMHAARHSPLEFATAKNLYGRFTLDQLTQHRAAVVFPYTAHTSYGFSELVALALPLFLPTPQFALDLGLIVDRLLQSDSYCSSAWKGELLLPPQPHPSLYTAPSPESSNSSDVLWWLAHSDFYTTPHVVLFHSWGHLVEVLEGADFAGMHARMVESNRLRKGEVRMAWEGVAERVAAGRALRQMVPSSYEAALQGVLGGVGSVQSD